MFKSAYFKLTLFYVLIIMVISVSFSVVLYFVSTGELNRGLRRQTSIITEMPREFPPPLSRDDFERIRQETFGTSQHRLLINLININLIVLILSSVFSYFMAKRTIGPIERSLESQKRFTADASHELRTPLTAIKTEIEVGLRDKNLSASDAKKLLKSNLQEVEKLQTLSGALLKLAQLDDKAKLEKKTINLAEITMQARDNLSKQAKEKAIKFDISAKNLSVAGDKDMLIEALSILFENAIKYSPKHSTVKVIIKKDDHQAKIVIADKGVGIHPEDLPHIFDRFYRADKSRTKSNVDGYGLGLSIVKNIIDLHSGQISAQSTPPKGSTFTIELPI